jgi:phosphoglycolate phosphatase-like HAD superfamily hydrolase
MQSLAQLRHIIFDFDGVLAETNQIRIEGFRTLFSSYSAEAQDSIVSFARANGGLSRYVKIRHFFENIISQAVSDEKIQRFAAAYSEIVKDKIIAADAVSGSREFLLKWVNYLDFAIISGSDESELCSVCVSRDISHFFSHIFGSPATKQENFQRLFDVTGWQRQNCLFVGDSINDLTAARDMGVPFIARNSGLEVWQSHEVNVISDLTELEANIFIDNHRRQV